MWIFLMGGMSKFLAVGQDFPPSYKGSGEGWGTVHTWRVQHFFDILGKNGDTWHILLGDNPVDTVLH